jgi:hypothetical protein
MVGGKLTTITTVLIPLIGVIVGATGAFLAQYLSTRVSKQQAEAAAKASARAERKEAIMTFLQAAQAVEHAAEQRYESGNLPESFTASMHNLWFEQKRLELICSTALNDKALSYVWCIHQACYRQVPEDTDIWQFLRKKREPFLARAREELGITPV